MSRCDSSDRHSRGDRITDDLRVEFLIDYDVEEVQW